MSEGKSASLADSASGVSEITDATYEHVVNAREAFIRLSQQPVDLPIAQKFLKTKKILDAIGQTFGEKRDAVAAEMGTPEGPGKWKLEASKVEEFQQAITDLLKKVVDIPRDAYLTMRSDLQGVRISAEDLDRLAFLILDLE